MWVCCHQRGSSISCARRYLSLAEISLEFAGMVAGSITEEDGEDGVDPVVLAGVSMDHLSHLSGLVRWIRG